MRNIRIRSALLAVALSLFLTGDVWAKARYAGKAEMVRESGAIAVIEVTAIEACEVKGRHWTYRQRASARIVSVIKGDLPKEKDAAILLYGEENFICARCRFEPGRHLVFLSQDSGLWVGSNWHLSVRPIQNDRDKGELVEWYADDKGIQLESQSLVKVIADVQKLLENVKRQD